MMATSTIRCSELLEVTVGQAVRLTFTFTDDDGDLVDAATTSAQAKPPTGAVVDLTGSIVHDSTGVYHVVHDYPNVVGDWIYRFDGTSPAAMAEVRVTVRRSWVPAP